MQINAPISEVFTYFARPEHMADQFPENMGLNVIPLEVKNGFGVGTIFRINGDWVQYSIQNSSFTHCIIFG
jgi:uncharacterized protein YndB with AHSA1/START domain